MSPGQKKLQALARMVALRQRMEAQAQANLRRVRLAMAESAALLQTPWATHDAPQRAADLECQQLLRDVGYVRLAEQQVASEALQQTLQQKHRALRQVEVLQEHAQSARAQAVAKREARDTDNWLRRGKETEGDEQ